MKTQVNIIKKEPAPNIGLQALVEHI